MDLKYGKGRISFEAPPNTAGVVEPAAAAVEPVESLLKKSFTSPSGQAGLSSILRKNKPGDVVVIVSDITRGIANYEEILEFLVAEMVDAGIDEKNIIFVIALGTHRKHTPEENARLYGRLCEDFEFLPHDCRRELAVVGKTSTGLEVSVNRRVREADFVIATGRVGFHYLAGYSGGRKAILPGVASYDTIRGNHSKLLREGVFVTRTRGNIIAQEMSEAAALVGVDYLLNVVETPERETAGIHCGHLEPAFNEALDHFVAARRRPVSEPADCVIVSAGGYPGDRDFYHTHKAMNLAMLCLRPHGSIILAGECAEGFGNEKFLRLMRENGIDALLRYPEERIEVGGHRAFLTARILRQHRVYVLARLDHDVLGQMHFTPVQSIEQALDAVRKEKGDDFRTLVVPDGTAVLPILDGADSDLSHTGGQS